MKHKLIIPAVALAVGVLAVGATAVFAAPGAPGGHRGGHFGGRFARIAKALHLTAAQRTQARTIVQDAHQRASQVFTPEQRAQMKQMRAERGKRGGPMAGLQLTEAQKTQIKGIRTEARAKAEAIRNNGALSATDKQTQLRDLHKATFEQIRAVFTPEQQAAIKDRMAKRHEGMQRLNLTTEQRAQLKSIREDTIAKLRAILTPAQQQQADQFLAKHPGFQGGCHREQAGK